MPIHKKVIISKGTDGHENPPPKYEPHKRMYYCTSEQPVSGKIADKFQELTKHVLKSDVVFPGNLYQGYKMDKNLHSLRKNLSESHTTTNIQSLRDPYSFFLTVVSQASKPDGNLPGYNLSCPDKSAELII